MREYRVILDGDVFTIPDTSLWNYTIETASQRGLSVRLECRDIYPDDSIFEMLSDHTGWLRLRDGRVVSPWNVLADNSPRAPLLIGGQPAA